MNPLEKKYHSNLSEYFLSKPIWFDEEFKEKPNIRKLAELPWQYTQTNNTYFPAESPHISEGLCRNSRLSSL